MSWVGFSAFAGGCCEAHGIIYWKFKINTTVNLKYNVNDYSLSSTEIEDGFDINSSGTVVGQTISHSPFTIQSWLRNGSNESAISSLGGSITSPYGMNVDGWAVNDSNWRLPASSMFSC